jgi:hypothetical protein
MIAQLHLVIPAPRLNLLFHELRKDGVEMRRRMHGVGEHEGLIGSFDYISLRRTEQRSAECGWIVQVQQGRFNDLSRQNTRESGIL